MFDSVAIVGQEKDQSVMEVLTVMKLMIHSRQVQHQSQRTENLVVRR